MVVMMTHHISTQAVFLSCCVGFCAMLGCSALCCTSVAAATLAWWCLLLLLLLFFAFDDLQVLTAAARTSTSRCLPACLLVCLCVVV